MFIFNTLKGKKESLENPKRGPLKLFVCGPTVYDLAHIGHARTYIFFDVVKRYLTRLEYKVKYLQNITDVEDKIILRAKRENQKPLKLAGYYEKRYLADMKKLGVTSVDKYARASDYIPEIIGQIAILLTKGNAYIISGDGIYFDLKSFPEYGKLSRRTVEQAEDATSRIDESVHKKNKGDFVLWKLIKGSPSTSSWQAPSTNSGSSMRRKKYRLIDGEPAWQGPWGWGRPGWHIEDTAITEKYFGPQYDIHGGGLDLKFPHHEAEIAEQESASGKIPFVKIWMHTGFVLVNGKKMSKSLENFVTVDDFLKKYSSDVLRMMVLKHHYRSHVDYSEELARESKHSLQTLLHTMGMLNSIVLQKYKAVVLEGLVLGNLIEVASHNFYGAMNDDFNTPKALASLFELINNLQKDKGAIWGVGKTDAKKVHNFMQKAMGLLGLSPKLPKIPLKIQSLAKKRELLRSNKHFAKADDLRKEIGALGYTVEDTPLGFFLWPKEKSK